MDDHVVTVKLVPELDDSAVAEFRQRAEAMLLEALAGLRLPSAEAMKLAPVIDEEALLNAVVKVISGVAVVKPGDVLAIRVSDWTPDQVQEYQDYLDHRAAAGEIPFKAVVVPGDELAAVDAGMTLNEARPLAGLPPA